MDQNRNQGKICSVFRRIKYFLTPQVRLDARLLDFMQEHPELTPNSEPLEAPPSEFQKILTEMNERGIKPAVKKQIKVKRCFVQAGKWMQKPVFVALLVVLFLGGTSAGVSAKKAYDYRVREREVGRSDIVLNNDQNMLIQEDRLSDAYQRIEEELGIKPLKMMKMPFDMKFSKLDIQSGDATIIFDYCRKKIYFVQAKSKVAASNSISSDRKEYKKVKNIYLKETFIIEKNNLPEGEVEFSTGIRIEGANYYLSGILPEEEFIDVIKNLNFY